SVDDREPGCGSCAPMQRSLWAGLWTGDDPHVEVVAQPLAERNDAQLCASDDQPRDYVNDARPTGAIAHRLAMAKSARASPTPSRRPGWAPKRARALSRAALPILAASVGSRRSL